MKEHTLLRHAGILASLTGLLILLFGDLKTAQNFRILSDLVQNTLLFTLILFIFMPSDRTMKIAFLIGGFTVLVDFILETVAVYLDWWYPLGGTQFPPVIVVPLEMVASFFLMGASMAIMLTFPERIRGMDFKMLNGLKWFVKDPKFDWIWRVLLIFLNALIGMNGDYAAGPEIWVPGPSWMPLYTFFVWLGGGLLTLLMFYLLQNRLEE